MAFVAADWSIDRTTGNIRYIGDDHNGASPSYATVIEFHRALQDFADDASSSGDDELDITDDNPSDRSTDNIITLLGTYNIDDAASEHLYDGSIIQSSGNVVYDGIVNFGNPEIELGIIQDGAVIADDWWNQGGSHGTATGGSTSTLTDTGQSWITDEWVGYVVRNVTDGSQGLITSNTATELTISDLMYGGTNNTNASAETYFIAKGLNADATNGISHRFMIKVRTGGADTDNKKLIGFSRTFQRTYSEFTINSTSNGNNVLACSDGTDLNNATAPNSIYDSVATAYQGVFAGISNVTSGYNALDVNNDGADEFFYSEWDRGSGTINDLYEYAKYQSRYKSELTTPLYGLAGDLFRGITHQVDVGSGTGSELWVQNEEVSWGTGTNRGILLAVDDTTDANTTKLWIQLTRGVAPVASDTITGAAAENTVTSSTARALNYPFIGQSTGSALIGAYGVGVETADLTNSDSLRGLDNVVYTPPNNVTFTVSGLITEQDRVLVAPTASAGSTVIQTNQLALQSLLNTDNVSSIQVSTTIPSDTPAAGVIRVLDDNGFYRRIKYSSYATDTFTVDTTYHGSADANNPGNTTAEDFATVNASASNNVWVAYIDDIADSPAFSVNSGLTIGVDYVIEDVGTTTTWSNVGATGVAGEVFTATATGTTGDGTVKLNNTSEAFTSVFSSTRNLVVKVRDGGTSPIKEFLSSAQLTNSGGSSTAIRTSDA